MNFTNLRLAFTAGCSVIGLLLIVLWARSYWTADYISRFDSSKLQTSFGSNRGTLFYSQLDWSSEPGSHIAPHGWTHKTAPATESHEKRWLGWNSSGISTRVAASHWLAILLFAALAAVPWIRWRFKLSTLLIAMTAIAALVATAVATN